MSSSNRHRLFVDRQLDRSVIAPNRARVDADVARTRRVERFAPPASPSVAQCESGDARHQVELGWLRQAQPDRVHEHTAAAYPEVVQVENLCDGVVPPNIDHDVVDFDALSVDEL